MRIMEFERVKRGLKKSKESPLTNYVFPVTFRQYLILEGGSE